MDYYTPKETTQIFLDSVQEKTSTSWMKFCVMAILGGAFIALGGLLSVMVSGGMTEIGSVNPGLIKFVAGALFPVGLIMVSIGGVDLFTSNCASFTLSGMERQINWKLFLNYLLFSYLFNFVGTQLIAYFLTYKVGLLQTEPWLSYMHQYAE